MEWHSRTIAWYIEEKQSSLPRLRQFASITNSFGKNQPSNTNGKERGMHYILEIHPFHAQYLLLRKVFLTSNCSKSFLLANTFHLQDVLLKINFSTVSPWWELIDEVWNFSNFCTTKLILQRNFVLFCKNMSPPLHSQAACIWAWICFCEIDNSKPGL